VTAGPAGPGRLRRAGGVMRTLAMDAAPLRRSPPFRRLWLGQAVSLTGSQMTAVALPVQVYALTRSSFDVGLLGLAALVPLVASGLLGATLVDAVDRRRLALVTSTLLLLVSAALLGLAASGVRTAWPLYLVIAVQSALVGVDSPARQTFTPRLVEPDLLPAANGLNQIAFNAATTLGPLLAGLLIATVGLRWAYAVDVASFLAALASLAQLQAMPPQGGGTRAGMLSVVEGLAFLRSRRDVMMTFVVDLVAMIFGMPRALFPALAVHQFHHGPGLVGVLYSAVAVGALVGAGFGGWFGRVRRQGLAVLLAVAVWGLAITGFGLVHAVVPALLLLAAAGAADMVSAVFRNTILQVATPDELRGRMSGVFTAVVAGGPRLGDLESGSVATLTSNATAVVSGGVACLVGVGLLALAAPSFRRYRSPEPAPAAVAASDVAPNLGAELEPLAGPAEH
jgi:MFS family permease